jgi:hypothetical protein
MAFGKYIIVECGGREEAIICSNLMQHSDAADGRKVVSGGFFQIFKDGEGQIDVCTFGESVSLRKKSREEDTKIVKRTLMPPDY